MEGAGPIDDYDRQYVAVDGDLALMPTLRDAAGAPVEGHVDVYRRADDGTWAYETTIDPPSDGTVHVAFGKALELRGTTAAILSESDGESVILLYERDAAGAWTLRSTLLRGEGVGTMVSWAADVSMASSPGVLVVGLPDSDEALSAVRVYERGVGPTGSWHRRATIRVPPSDHPFPRVYFGSDVDVSRTGDLIAVANSIQNNDSGLGAHEAVHIYERDPYDPTRWNLLDTIPADELPSTQSTYVEIDGDIVAVTHMPVIIGDFVDVHVYRRGVGGGDAWGLVATHLVDLDTPGDLVVDYAQASLRLRGSTLVVSLAPVSCFERVIDLDPPPEACGSGRVFVFERDEGGEDAWGLLQLIEPVPSYPMQLFGAALDLSSDGRTLLIGTNPRDVDGGQDGEGEGLLYVR
jgi:hypothetical protein